MTVSPAVERLFLRRPCWPRNTFSQDRSEQRQRILDAVVRERIKRDGFAPLPLLPSAAAEIRAAFNRRWERAGRGHAYVYPDGESCNCSICLGANP